MPTCLRLGSLDKDFAYSAKAQKRTARAKTGQPGRRVAATPSPIPPAMIRKMVTYLCPIDYGELAQRIGRGPRPIRCVDALPYPWLAGSRSREPSRKEWRIGLSSRR